MIGTIWMMFLALGAAVVFALAVASFRKWPQIPLYCVTIFAATVWDFPVRPPLANIMGTSIMFEDAIIVTAIATVALNPAQFWKTVGPYNVVVVVSIICIAVSLINGLATFGPNTAVNEFRSFLYPLGMVAWFLNQDWMNDSRRHRFRRWVLVTGLAITVAGLIHIALYGLGQADSFVVSALSGEEMTSRPLTSDQAAMLALFGLLLFKFWETEKRRQYSYLGLVFIGLAIISQHRSVWVALAIALVPIALRLRHVAATRFVVGVIAAAVVGAMVLLSGAADGIVQPLIYSAQRGGTYLGRLDSWSTLVSMAFDRGAWSVIFGEPFGFGYLRPEYRGFMISYAPHNWYVSIFLRLGLVGLALFLCVIGWGFSRLWRGQDRVVAMGVFLAILIYMWNYSLSWHLSPIFAWALALAAHTSPAAAALRPSQKPRKAREEVALEKGILLAETNQGRLRARSAEPAPGSA